MTIFVHRLRSILSSFLLLFILWFTVGCPAVQLRDAQDNFNKGAEIELKALDRSLLSDNPDANPGDALAALNEYRLAHTLAEGQLLSIFIQINIVSSNSRLHGCFSDCRCFP